MESVMMLQIDETWENAGRLSLTSRNDKKQDDFYKSSRLNFNGGAILCYDFCGV